MMNGFAVRGRLRSISITDHLDNLIRTNDPYLEKKLIQEVRTALNSTQSTPLDFSLTAQELNLYTHKYGEQYVVDAATDITRHFDIINHRFFSRLIPTQLAALYLFGGGGKSYKPNISSVSTAGEALAGYCMERRFGFTPLARPLGVMPDAVMSQPRGGRTYIALVETKASVSSKTGIRLVEDNVSKFLLDVKTRANRLGNQYEGYLFCAVFEDGGKVDCACLHVDLQYYCPTSESAPLDISLAPAPLDRPADRLRD